MKNRTASIKAQLPDYLCPEKRSKMGKRNDMVYEQDRIALQAELDRLPLPEALQALQEQQMDVGFIMDDLREVRYFQCINKQNGAYFIGQFNPKRANRSLGSGRTIPPPGVETKGTQSPKCFLCTENVRWQSRGIQKCYRFEVNGNAYIALCNPFPFMPTHITIASGEHEPQSWHKTVAWKGDKVERLVRDLYEVARQLPGYVCFYNGVGAGASIEEHFHFQAFQIPNGHGSFPLQHIAGRVEIQTRAAAMIPEEIISTTYISAGDYPLTAFRIKGDRGKTTKAVVERIKKWNTLVSDSASANITAIWENGELVFYLIPRNRFYSRSTGMAGVVGGLEVLGEFIFCTPAEDEIINTQRVDFNYMEAILRGVTPPNIERLNAPK